MSRPRMRPPSLALLPWGLVHQRKPNADADGAMLSASSLTLFSWPASETAAHESNAIVVAQPAKKDAAGPLPLQEEEFQESLKSIIDRDFYPELWSPYQNPDVRGRIQGVSLNQFLDAHISEDNFAFAEIIEKEKESRPPKPVNPNLPLMLTDSDALLLLKDSAPMGREKETRPFATRFRNMPPPPSKRHKHKRKESNDFDGYQIMPATPPASVSKRAASVSSILTSASGRARKRVLSEAAQALVKRLSHSQS